MKRPELADLARKPEPPAQEPRPGKRSRHEHESRQPAARRAPPPPPLSEPIPETSAPLCGAPGERSVPDLPIGTDADAPAPSSSASAASSSLGSAACASSPSSASAGSPGSPFSLFSSLAFAPSPNARRSAGDVIGHATLAAAPAVEWIFEDDADAPAETIIGSGDRAHHLALAAGQGRSPPPRPLATPDPLLGPARARSRAECRRRCGKADTCDPSSELGCGGEYCGRSFAAARDAL